MKVLKIILTGLLLLALSSCSDLLGNKELQKEFKKKQSQIRLDGPGSKLINDENLPIFVVDGKVWAFDNAIDESKLNPDNIETVRILKDKKSIKRFGSAGKNGAILITTKKKAEH